MRPLAGLVLVLLTACAGQQASPLVAPTTSVEARAAARVVEAPSAPVPPRKPARKRARPQPVEQPGKIAAVEAREAIQGALPESIDPKPAADIRLVGLSEAETVQVLGPPAAELAAAPGKIWHYSAEFCQLEIHLFQDVERGGFHALDYTASGTISPADCVGRIAARRSRGT